MLLRSLADVRTSVEVTDEPETAGLGGHKGLARPGVRPLSDITAKFHPLGSFENPSYKRSGPNSFPAELPWQQQLLRNLVQLLVGTGRVQLELHSGLSFPAADSQKDSYFPCC